MAFIQPNFYSLSGGGLHVTYSTSGISGQPHLHYASPFLTRNFTGNEIHSAPSPLGTLVTVTIQMTVDSGSTSFTLLVPRVNLNGPADSVHIVTEGITTHHRFSVFQGAMHGQLDTYSVTALSGNASHVEFIVAQKPETKVA
jgi:hypothetical protein